MADRRPGGLTALAVFNFIFGGLGLIVNMLALLVVGAVDVAADSIANETMDPEVAQATAEVSSSLGILYLVLVLGILSAGLLITSGVGYIKQKLFLGRKLGNAYAVISLTGVVLGLAVGGGGFGIGTILGLIYPVLTLALLNTTFKEDLVN